MSESTEIANAIYYLASTIKSAAGLLSFVALLLWAGAVSSSGSGGKGGTK